MRHTCFGNLGNHTFIEVLWLIITSRQPCNNDLESRRLCDYLRQFFLQFADRSSSKMVGNRIRHRKIHMLRIFPIQCHQWSNELDEHPLCFEASTNGLAYRSLWWIDGRINIFSGWNTLTETTSYSARNAARNLCTISRDIEASSEFLKSLGEWIYIKFESGPLSPDVFSPQNRTEAHHRSDSRLQNIGSTQKKMQRHSAGSLQWS